MAIDFDALVLAPCLDAFAKPITVTPTRSQPYGAPYTARGVWEVKSVDIATEDGGVLSSRTIHLGIRLSEFAVAPPRQGDWITARAADIPLAWWQGFAYDPNGTLDFDIDDLQPDGQGGAELTLKVRPPNS